jgi:hypothetical protein
MKEISKEDNKQKTGVLLLNVSKLRPIWGFFTMNISTTVNGVTPRVVSNERETSKEDNKQKTGGATPKRLKVTPMWGIFHN